MGRLPTAFGAAVSAALLLTACGTAPAPAHRAGATPARSGSAPVRSAPATTPAPATTASASPSRSATAPATASASATTQAPAACPRGPLRVRLPAPAGAAHAVCVHAGAQITVSLSAVPSYKWSPVSSSAPGVVLVLANHAMDGGSLVEIARAQAPGTAVLSATDTFTGVVPGPTARPWRLTVQVVP